MPKDTILVMRSDRLNNELEQMFCDPKKDYVENLFDKYFECLWRISVVDQFLSERGLIPEFNEWQNEFWIGVNLEKEAIRKIDEGKDGSN